MGAQISKTAGKEEVAAEGAAVAAKSNGQENGHAKSNGDASPAAEEANHANGGAPGDEAPKEAVEKVEVAEANGDKEPAATNGEASAKPEEEGTPSSEDGKQKRKRFSFKKPSFKLTGFSFRKTKKDSEEGADEGAAAPAEGEKAASEEEAATAAAEEEAKPTEAAEETAKEAPAEEAKTEEVKAEEKPAEASPAEPETAASPEAPAAAE